MGRYLKAIHPDLIPPAPHLELESSLWAQGIRHIAGVDEAGRGALAGPVTAAAVILPPGQALLHELDGVRDSKQMSPQQRTLWSERLKTTAKSWAVGFASSSEIDRWGILPATRLAVRRALAGLEVAPQHLMLDYLLIPDDPTPQTSLTKGDARSLTIAAASILAKTARDECMRLYDDLYPAFGFARHKGYGTASHRAILAQRGPCPLHRRSFAPLRFSAAGR